MLHGVHRQAVVATFVTTYMRQDTTWKREKKKKRKKRKKEEERGRQTNHQVDMKKKESNDLNRNWTVIECKSTQISVQKHDEMFQRVSSGVPIPIKSFAVVKNMSPWLDWILIAWARKFLIWEESKSVLSNGRMVSDCSGSSSA